MGREVFLYRTVRVKQVMCLVGTGHVHEDRTDPAGKKTVLATTLGIGIATVFPTYPLAGSLGKDPEQIGLLGRQLDILVERPRVLLECAHQGRSPCRDLARDGLVLGADRPGLSMGLAGRRRGIVFKGGRARGQREIGVCLSRVRRQEVEPAVRGHVGRQLLRRHRVRRVRILVRLGYCHQGRRGWTCMWSGRCRGRGRW